MTRVLVMGLGRFGGGLAAARWFARRGDEVCVTDLRGDDQLASGVAALAGLPGVRLVLGRHDPADFDACEVLVVNPAVPFDHPLVARARASGARVATEMGLTLQHLPGPCVAVTGTNGKSTTASLCAAMLQASGARVLLGGNMGRPLLEEIEDTTRGTVVVLEISSFQLAWLEHTEFAPLVGVVTNVSGDHLDRHGTMEHYVASKRKLVEAVPREGTVVLREEDPVCREYAASARGRVVWFGAALPPPVPLPGLRLLGAHNRANAAAAAHAALAAGATPEGCAAAAEVFRPLTHRLEPVAEIGGVLCIDDSVSTTPEAAAAAVAAFDRPVVLLAGGKDKGLDRAPLLAAARRARAVVAYGEVGPSLAAALGLAGAARGLDEAVEQALLVARPGDVLLLSPGFSSYDEFPGFDARATRFRALLAAKGASPL